MIMICYRRSDSRTLAYRMFDWLVDRYGRETVFIDIDDVPVGVDFREKIRETVRKSDVLLVIIGQAWLGPLEKGTTRIQRANDPVRMEVETAFEYVRPIVPVLVDDAIMPAETDLPGTIKQLAFINAAEVDGGRDFRGHMKALCETLDRILGRRTVPVRRGSSDEQRSGPEREEHVSGPNLVRAPIDGVAYRGRSSGGEFLTEVGNSVQAGDDLLIIYDMANLNKIPAPYAGELVKIFFKEGDPVKFGDPLMLIEPSKVRFDLDFSGANVVRSPMVGTVYFSPEPNADPFVQVGTEVKADDTLLIIEAMKMMNRVKGRYPGVVTQILVEDGMPVEFDEPLILVEPASEAPENSDQSKTWRADPNAVVAPSAATAIYLASFGKSDPFVKIGDQVKAGDTLALIEVMMTTVPITAPHSGTLTKILISDTAPIEAGEPLFIVEPSVARFSDENADADTLGDLARYPGVVLSTSRGTVHRTRGAKPMVEVGKQVQAGDRLLLISNYDYTNDGDAPNETEEEIIAPRTGTVRRILVNDRQSVEYGTPLLIVI
jgi:biotin carboxyl carrier protein